jgi:uncharacterized protein (UPF0276 family)
MSQHALRSPIGVGLRRAHFGAFLANKRDIDFVEIIAEAFVDVGGLAARALGRAKEHGPVMVHGVSLGLGNEGPLSTPKLDGLARFLEALGAHEYSDHVCASASEGIESFDLLPLPFHAAAIDYVSSRAREARAILGQPIVLENITYYAAMPDSVCTEGAFYSELLAAADAHLLLDVANVVVNAKNFGVDARTLIDALPLERVRQVHLAGHRFDKRWGLTIDDHASPVSDETIALARYALQRIGAPVPILIEWDQQLPEFDVLLDEAARVRRLLSPSETTEHAHLGAP